ncbi:MAG: saccharopine dehydrogenase family protein, partial [Myxococcaceae bacterium]
TRAGTHYADLTGEPQFVREMIDLHHANAQKTGAKIVHCCGFDSIPSDLGVLMMQEHARKKFGRPLDSIRFYVRKLSGGISGGTIASALLLAEEMGKDPTLRKRVANPYLLDPDREGRGPDSNDQMAVKWDADANAWTGPFVMAAINTRIVRRSNALQGYAYGKDFRYSEVMSFKPGVQGAVMATSFTAGLGAFFLSAASSPGRALLRKVLPASGEGPSEESRKHGHFHIQLIGHGSDAQGHPVRLVGNVRGVNDPGYGETSKMLGETAIALADPKAPNGGGVLTPASTPGLGITLIERLRRAGMTFEVEGA